MGHGFHSYVTRGYVWSSYFLIFHQFRCHSPRVWEEFLLSSGLDWKRKRDDLALLSGCQFHRGGNWSSSASAVGSVGRVAQVTLPTLQYLNQWRWETLHQMKLDSDQQTLSNRNGIFKQHIMRIASTKSEENQKNIQEPMDTFLMSQHMLGHEAWRRLYFWPNSVFSWLKSGPGNMSTKWGLFSQSSRRNCNLLTSC